MPLPSSPPPLPSPLLLPLLRFRSSRLPSFSYTENRQGPTAEMRQRSLRRRDRSRFPLGFLLPHARSHPPGVAFSPRLGQPQRSSAHSMCHVYLEEPMGHITKLLECIKYGTVATLADCSVDIRSGRFWTAAIYLPHCFQCFGHLSHFIFNDKMELKREKDVTYVLQGFKKLIDRPQQLRVSSASMPWWQQTKG